MEAESVFVESAAQSPRHLEGLLGVHECLDQLHELALQRDAGSLADTLETNNSSTSSSTSSSSSIKATGDPVAAPSKRARELLLRVEGLLNGLQSELQPHDEVSAAALTFLQQYVAGHYASLLGTDRRESKDEIASPQSTQEPHAGSATVPADVFSQDSVSVAQNDAQETAQPALDDKQPQHLHENLPIPGTNSASRPTGTTPVSFVIDEEYAGFLAASDLFLKNDKQCDSLRTEVLEGMNRFLGPEGRRHAAEVAEASTMLQSSIDEYNAVFRTATGASSKPKRADESDARDSAIVPGGGGKQASKASPVVSNHSTVPASKDSKTRTPPDILEVLKPAGPLGTNAVVRAAHVSSSNLETDATLDESFFVVPNSVKHRRGSFLPRNNGRRPRYAALEKLRDRAMRKLRAALPAGIELKSVFSGSLAAPGTSSAQSSTETQPLASDAAHTPGDLQTTSAEGVSRSISASAAAQQQVGHDETDHLGSPHMKKLQRELTRTYQKIQAAEEKLMQVRSSYEFHLRGIKKAAVDFVRLYKTQEIAGQRLTQHVAQLQGVFKQLISKLKEQTIRADQGEVVIRQLLAKQRMAEAFLPNNSTPTAARHSAAAQQPHEHLPHSFSDPNNGGLESQQVQTDQNDQADHASSSRGILISAGANDSAQQNRPGLLRWISSDKLQLSTDPAPPSPVIKELEKDFARSVSNISNLALQIQQQQELRRTQGIEDSIESQRSADSDEVESSPSTHHQRSLDSFDQSSLRRHCLSQRPHQHPFFRDNRSLLDPIKEDNDHDEGSDAHVQVQSTTQQPRRSTSPGVDTRGFAAADGRNRRRRTASAGDTKDKFHETHAVGNRRRTVSAGNADGFNGHGFSEGEAIGGRRRTVSAGSEGEGRRFTFHSGRAPADNGLHKPMGEGRSSANPAGRGSSAGGNEAVLYRNYTDRRHASNPSPSSTQQHQNSSSLNQHESGAFWRGGDGNSGNLAPVRHISSSIQRSRTPEGTILRHDTFLMRPQFQPERQRPAQPSTQSVHAFKNHSVTNPAMPAAPYHALAGPPFIKTPVGPPQAAQLHGPHRSSNAVDDHREASDFFGELMMTSDDEDDDDVGENIHGHDLSGSLNHPAPFYSDTVRQTSRRGDGSLNTPTAQWSHQHHGAQNHDPDARATNDRAS